MEVANICLISRHYLKINQDILILRDYSAGSNATTMLCVDNEKNFFRKYAIGSEGDKLYQQIEWLLKYKDILPLCKIIRYEKDSEYCYYDMVYENNAVGMFQYIHSMPKEKAWFILQDVIQCLEKTLYEVNSRIADKETISAYIDNKVYKNINRITNAKYIKQLMEYEDIIINGKKHKNFQLCGWIFQLISLVFLTRVLLCHLTRRVVVKKNICIIP